MVQYSVPTANGEGVDVGQPGLEGQVGVLPELQAAGGSRRQWRQGHGLRGLNGSAGRLVDGQVEVLMHEYAPTSSALQETFGFQLVVNGIDGVAADT